MKTRIFMCHEYKMCWAVDWAKSEVGSKSMAKIQQKRTEYDYKKFIRIKG